MTIPKTYALQFRIGGGGPAVYEIAAGMTPVQAGADLTSVVEDDPAFNEANKFKGWFKNFKGNTFCCFQGYVFRRRYGSDDDWEEVYAGTISTANNRFRFTSLVTYVDLNGVLNMAFVYDDSINHTILAKTTTGLVGEWDEVDFGDNNGGLKTSEIVFQDKIFYIDADQNQVVSIDPVAETRAAIGYSTALNTATEGWNQMFIHQDRLFMFGLNASTNELALAEFTGANFDLYGDISDDGNDRWSGVASDVNIGHPAIWSDGTYIRIFVNGRASDLSIGSSFFRVHLDSTNPVNGIELSDPVVPATLRDSRAGITDRRDRWHVYVDNDTDPVNPDVYILFLEAADSANNWVLYQFVDDNTVLSNLGTWVTGAYSVVHSPNGGNEQMVLDENAAYAVPETYEEVLGGFKIGYRVYGALGTSPVTIRLLYDDTQGSYPDNVATLTGAVTGGGVRNGNLVEDITPDDGATLHTLVWDVETDNVDIETPLRIVFDAF